MKQPPQSINAYYLLDGRKITVTLSGDDVHLGNITLTLPQVANPISTNEADLLTAAIACVAGQACLAPKLTLQAELDSTQRRIVNNIAQLLYDDHAHVQRKPFVDVNVTANEKPAILSPAKPPINAQPTCLLLWSGGKDGLAALKILRANGYNVIGLHSTANFSTITTEFMASQRLAAAYDMPLHIIDLKWEVIAELARKYSSSFDIFPTHNSIPHGRDVFLTCIASLLAEPLGAQYICAGYERGPWLKTQHYSGRAVVKDLSVKAARYINELVLHSMGVRFFSPLAAYSEFAVFRNLMATEAAAWGIISSCFWGNWCGHCDKCLRYGLMQKALGKNLIPFRKEPLSSDSPAYRKSVKSFEEGTLPTILAPVTVYCFITLYQRGELDHQSDIYRFLHRRHEYLDATRQQLAEELNSIIPAELAPADFINIHLSAPTTNADTAMKVGVSVKHEQITIHLSQNDQKLGDISIIPGESIKDITTVETALLASAAGSIAGQTSLTSHLHFDFPMDCSSLEIVRARTQFLYDSYAFSQDLPFSDVNISAKHAPIPSIQQSVKPRKCVLLWSGGKDSLAALLVLRANGYDVTGIHVPANYSTKDADYKAALKLAELYDLQMHVIDIEWKIIHTLTKQYAINYDIYPHQNSVPFGRDFLLGCTAAILARRINAHYVCAGFEKDLWHQTYERDGRTIVRFEMQSVQSCTYLNNLLRNTLGLEFFSPLAGISEFSIFNYLTFSQPLAWQFIESCYWGGWCGKCVKCLRYALMQKALGTNFITFQSDPLSIENPDFMMMVNNIDRQTNYYWEMKAFCTAKIYFEGGFASLPVVEALLHTKKAYLENNYQKLLAILTSTNNTSLDPSGFRYSFE